MTTLGALKTEIALEIQRPDLVANGAVANAISAALRHYKRKRFYFNVRENVDVPTVAGTSDYSTADVKAAVRIDAAFRVESDGITDLTRAQPIDMEMLLGNNMGQGKPTSYAYVSRALRLFPRPDAIYTIRLYGLFYLAPPADDDEADNAWMTEAYDLIKYRAEASLYADYMEEDGMGMAQMKGRLEAEQYESLVAETFDRDMTGFIEPTEF